MSQTYSYETTLAASEHVGRRVEFVIGGELRGHEDIYMLGSIEEFIVPVVMDHAPEGLRDRTSRTTVSISALACKVAPALC